MMYDIAPVLQVLEEYEGDPRYLSQTRMAEVFGLTKKETKEILEAGVADDYTFDKMCCGLGFHPQEIVGIDRWINPVIGCRPMNDTELEAAAESALARVQAELEADWVIVEEDTTSLELAGVFVYAEQDEDGHVTIHIDPSQYEAEYDEPLTPWQSPIVVAVNGYLVHDGVEHGVATATWNPEAEAYEV
jgi:hypothetical protein